jgi:hypothetical protein
MLSGVMFEIDRVIDIAYFHNGSSKMLAYDTRYSV